MNKFHSVLIIITFLVTLTSCASSTVESRNERGDNLEEILDQAEANATEGGRKILETSREMISNQEIIIGGCWNYINAVYDRAGYPTKLRETIFKSKLKGPYLADEMILPGDWLYFVNHSYNETEHSAIFVAWSDEEKKEALMISYEGEKRKKPGIYKKYSLTNIYNIIRPQ
jgi:hypothetical protein